jgi:acyl-CoA synthetase (AMP-forming)/AMP-acid ligase II
MSGIPENRHPWYFAERRPEAPALIMGDTGELLTFGAMMSNANRLARLFRRLGLSEGDTVAFFMDNQPGYLELCWAAKDSGLFYVCIGRQLNAPDVAYILENSDAKLLVASDALSEVAIDALGRLPHPIIALMTGAARSPFESYQDAIAGEADTPLKGSRRGASMLYSSGTTGRPKGVRPILLDVEPEVPPARHAMLVANYGISIETVLVNPCPFYHVAPLRQMMHVQRMGGHAIGFRKFDAETVLRSVETYKGTHGFFVPTMLIRMLRLPESVRNSIDISSMRYVIHGAAPCAVAIKEQLFDWLGPILYEMYGGTEGNGLTTIGPEEWLTHKGSVGRPTKDTKIRILDEAGNECPPLVPGVIYMNNGRVFEYYNDPEKTAAGRVTDGFATLGDIGYRDEEGYLYLTDRQSNMIISGGVNIYPQEAENVLVGHPLIADVAVIGVPHSEFGEEVKAIVVPHASARGGAAAISYCRTQLSPIKCPRSVDFTNVIPRNEAGKVLKQELRQKYWPEGVGPVGSKLMRQAN